MHTLLLTFVFWTVTEDIYILRSEKTYTRSTTFNLEQLILMYELTAVETRILETRNFKKKETEEKNLWLPFTLLFIPQQYRSRQFKVLPHPLSISNALFLSFYFYKFSSLFLCSHCLSFQYPKQRFFLGKCQGVLFLLLLSFSSSL